MERTHTTQHTCHTLFLFVSRSNSKWKNMRCETRTARRRKRRKPQKRHSHHIKLTHADIRHKYAIQRHTFRHKRTNIRIHIQRIPYTQQKNNSVLYINIWKWENVLKRLLCRSIFSVLIWDFLFEIVHSTEYKLWRETESILVSQSHFPFSFTLSFF